VKRAGRRLAACAAACAALLTVLTVPVAAAADYTFDASEIEKKAFEWSGLAEAKFEGLRLRSDSPLYPLTLGTSTPRTDLQRATGTLELAAKWNAGPVTADLRTRSVASHDALASSSAHRVLEGGLHWALDTHWSLDAGKRVLRWGKGYAFSPVALVERPKDASDPQQTREGYTLLAAEWVGSFDGAWGGALQAASATAVLLPTSSHVNTSYGAAGHSNPALKLSALVADTDIDLLWAAAGSRPARWGLDLSRNLGSQLEVHAEWMRASGVTRPLVPATGATQTQQLNTTSWLLGLRYITEREVTWVAELYRNGAGYTQDEYAAFVRAAASTPDSNTARLAALALTPYMRPNPGRDYAYLRVSGKEPWDWLYVAPAITLLANLQDHSVSITPELVYTGIDNVELRARWVWLQGGATSEYGARPIRSRLEATARLSF
jgi:hypothetical protein